MRPLSKVYVKEEREKVEERRKRKNRQKRRREFKDGLELHKHEGQSLIPRTYGNTKRANDGACVCTWSGLHSTLWLAFA
ncbi:hypothetical protein OUZ56_005722 [Daphnia magna]|uniref:Uncharacterized protein n=1 Tax=Daphnia magna TaxID=35525 RepID=A0ABQ9YU90_9CRUS|nr:hypothetical protein OUZ56_005722 [Daphnia magna]